MLRTYKYRLYPNKAQKVLLEKHFGCTRLIYNLALQTKTMTYMGSKVSLSCFELHQQLTDLKKTYPWLKEVNSQSLQQKITDLDTAFKNFFKYNAGFPKFKSKHDKQSFRVNQNIVIDNNKLFIPKFKNGIKCKISRNFNGIIKQCTISKTKTGKYFVSILVEDYDHKPSKNKIKEENSIGLDAGIKDFMVDSDGNKYKNHKFLRESIQRIKVLQKRLSKKKNGSRNREKARLKLAKEYEKLKNRREDYLHKLSTKIVSENQGAIIVEDLNIKGMMKNHNLANSISDVSWGDFFRMLEYKADWYGRTFHKINRFEPSTKLCNNCGFKNKNLSLNDRKWECPYCKMEHDRDENAANNIKKIGIFNLIKNSGLGQPDEPVEMSALVESMKQESHDL